MSSLSHSTSELNSLLAENESLRKQLSCAQKEIQKLSGRAQMAVDIASEVLGNSGYAFVNDITWEQMLCLNDDEGSFEYMFIGDDMQHLVKEMSLVNSYKALEDVEWKLRILDRAVSKEIDRRFGALLMSKSPTLKKAKKLISELVLYKSAIEVSDRVKLMKSYKVAQRFVALLRKKYAEPLGVESELISEAPISKNEQRRQRKRAYKEAEKLKAAAQKLEMKAFISSTGLTLDSLVQGQPDCSSVAWIKEVQQLEKEKDREATAHEELIRETDREVDDQY